MASSVGSWVKTGKSHAIMIVITKLVLEGKRIWIAEMQGWNLNSTVLLLYLCHFR